LAKISGRHASSAKKRDLTQKTWGRRRHPTLVPRGEPSGKVSGIQNRGKKMSAGS